MGYFALLITSFLALPWDLDSIKLEQLIFHIRRDAFSNLLVYFHMSLYFCVGQRNRLILFRFHALAKFLISIILLAYSY